MVMKGDYMMSKWSGIVETNKNWLLLGALGSIGGSLIFIVVRGFSLVRKSK